MYDEYTMNFAPHDASRTPEQEENSVVPRGRHDPAGRKRLLVEAAAELIPEVGLAKLTHRMVAQRAGVSLGSTTRYFANLEELRKEGLLLMSSLLEQDLSSARNRFERDGCTPESLTAEISEFLADHDLVRITMELMAAANVDSVLRPLANHWAEGIIEMLSPEVGEIAARAIVLIMDGATMHAALNESPLDAVELQQIFAAVLRGTQAPETP